MVLLEATSGSCGRQTEWRSTSPHPLHLFRVRWEAGPPRQAAEVPSFHWQRRQCRTSTGGSACCPSRPTR